MSAASLSRNSCTIPRNAARNKNPQNSATALPLGESLLESLGLHVNQGYRYCTHWMPPGSLGAGIRRSPASAPWGGRAAFVYGSWGAGGSAPFCSGWTAGFEEGTKGILAHKTSSTRRGPGLKPAAHLALTATSFREADWLRKGRRKYFRAQLMEAGNKPQGRPGDPSMSWGGQGPDDTSLLLKRDSTPRTYNLP